MTKLLNPTPVIRWLRARDATSYKVSVFQGPTEIWSTSLGNVTQVQYPQDAKVALVPGKTYRVVISTSLHSSTEERMPNLGFAVLASAEAAKVREAEARIRDLHLPDATTRLLIAELYANWLMPDGPDGKALDAEAIELLEGTGEIKAPALARELGDLYLKVGLTGRAEDSYLRSLKLSQDAGDIENQALVQHALGIIFAKTTLNTDEALQRLQTALALYQSLGDSGAAAEVDQDIQNLRLR
jgi:tetratricopeptide (TPR) repeat protein